MGVRYNCPWVIEWHNHWRILAWKRVLSYNDISLRLSGSRPQLTKLRRSTMNSTKLEPYESYLTIQRLCGFLPRPETTVCAMIIATECGYTTYSQSNDFQNWGMTGPESRPLPQSITIPNVQERCTLRYIHQLKWIEVANAPGDELTSGLRERR